MTDSCFYGYFSLSFSDKRRLRMKLLFALMVGFFTFKATAVETEKSKDTGGSEIDKGSFDSHSEQQECWL